MIENLENVSGFPVKKIYDSSEGLAMKVLKRRAVVNRGVLNYCIDVSILVLSILCGVTGLVKWPGLVYSAGLSYQSLPFDTITWLHDWSGLIALVLVLVHLVLHWNWLLSMTKKIVKGVRREEA